ncbi:MAG TPA: carbohydrate kinase [Lacunisphaera sp.]
MSDRSILCLGEVLWDLFPTGPRFGGAAANCACHGALLGGNVALVSAVGDDSRGMEAVTILRDFGVDTSLVQCVADAPTGAVNVSLDHAGKPTFEINRDAAWDRIAWTPELAATVEASDAIYFGTLAQRSPISRATIRRALQIAEQKGLRRVLDVNLRRPFFDASLIRESISLASVLKFSDDEVEAVADACGIVASAGAETILLTLLQRFGLELVVMTRGAQGALLASRDKFIGQPGIPTDVRDTVGAGDAFAAALLVGLVRQDSLEDIALVACQTASAVCAIAGAVPTAAEYPRSQKPRSRPRAS